MTKEEALNIIRNVFLHEDNQLNNDGQIGAKDIHNALTIACAALCESSLPSDLEKEIQLYLAKLGFGDGDGWADGITINDLRDIARHFYALGKQAGAEWMAEAACKYGMGEGQPGTSHGERNP